MPVGPPCLTARFPPVLGPLGTMEFLEDWESVIVDFEFDSMGLPLFEHDKHTLKIDFSIITFLLTSVCLPHNSQKETIDHISLI